MTQQPVSNKSILELRGIKIDLGKLSRIQSPVLKNLIKRLYTQPNRNYKEYNDTRHSEYSDHKEYTEHYEDYKDNKEHSDYRDWSEYKDYGACSIFVTPYDDSGW